MATVQKVKLSSEMRYLNERLRDGRAVRQDEFSMKRLGKPDPAFQPRVVHLDMEHVKTLDNIKQARGYLDPVVVVHVAEENRDILVDGFHRHEVYKRAGELGIPAYVVEGTEEDAIEYAAMANQHAILKRTTEDVKKQISMLLDMERWAQKPDHTIGAHVGVKGSTVSKYRAAHYKERGLSKPEFFVRADGFKVARRGTSQSLPRISKSSTGYQTSIKGKNIYLGTRLADAQETLAEKLETTEQRRKVLNNTSTGFFQVYLPSFGVSLSTRQLTGKGRTFPGLGSIGIGYGRVVIIARLDEPAAIYTAIGRVYALREIVGRPDDTPVIVCVCYPDDGPEELVEVARRLGVELQTPEELVASIKGDAATPAESACPTDDLVEIGVDDERGTVA